MQNLAPESNQLLTLLPPSELNDAEAANNAVGSKLVLNLTDRRSELAQVLLGYKHCPTALPLLLMCNHIPS